MFSWSESNEFIFSLDEKILLRAISSFADSDDFSLSLWPTLVPCF